MKKLVSLFLALVMLCSVAAFATEAAPAEATVVYATSTFGEKFSTFFATTAYDMEVVDLTSGYLLTADRGGNPIRNGIEGETINYNGTDYTYYGMGNVEVVMNDDGSVDYNLTMRDDIKFSDGHPADIDDVIFGIYVLADPTYDGSSTIYAQPIEGMDEYYSSMSTLMAMIPEAGPENADFTSWTEEQQTAFWTAFDAAGEKFCQEILDYCIANGYNTAEDSVATIAANWGYELAAEATVADFWTAIVDTYGYDLSDEGINYETAGTSISEFILNELGDKAAEYTTGIATTDGVTSIPGIIKTGDYTMTIHMTEYDATSIYNMAFTIVPLHYYGDESLYNGVDSFGFPKGDLSMIREKTTKPLGCGAFVFEKYENGVVTLKSNPYYFLGEPAIKTLLMQEADQADYVPGVVTGTFDIALPSINADTVAALQDANSNGELTGDTVSTYLIDYRGYGYLGINADLVKVGEDSASEASKNLRKALMTMISVYRDTSINSYYGDRASVIQYPISNTSWAAPRPTDEGYQNCYSTDVDGNPIFTEGMNDEQKYEAALQAAIGFLKAAGYTWDEATSTFTAAPEGASMTYEAMIPGEGTQDHPAYGCAVAAAEQLAKVGITLQVNDVGTSTWNNALEGNTAQIWAAAWQSTADPDMYQVYHSSNAHGENTNSNHYQIVDSELDELIVAARTSTDTDFRKATYKTAMEIILDWACELPLYQRKDCTVVSTIRVDTETMPKDMTPYLGWYGEVEALAPNAVAAQ